MMVDSGSETELIVLTRENHRRLLFSVDSTQSRLIFATQLFSAALRV